MSQQLRVTECLIFLFLRSEREGGSVGGGDTVVAGQQCRRHAEDIAAEAVGRIRQTRLDGGR